MEECVSVRFPNKFMPDTPQRIACDTSQKIPVRFGETIKSYIAKGMDVSSLEFIPFFFAGWLRYLMGTDNSGKVMELSPDPKLDELTPLMKGVSASNLGGVKKILSDESIFGVDLYKYGLGQKTERYFVMMLESSVRKALDGLFA